MLQVKDAKLQGIIPESYHNILDDDCPLCGSPREISENLKYYGCSNIRCPAKVSYRITSMLQDLGYKNIGYKTIYPYVKSNNIKSTMEFIFDPLYSVYDILDVIKEKKYTAPQLVNLLHIPDLGRRTELIFNKINSASDYDTRLKQAGSFTKFVQESVNGDSLISNLAKTLQEFDDDIYIMLDTVPPVEQMQIRLPIAITGHITRVKSDQGKLTKSGYIELLNQYARKMKSHFVLSDALTQVLFVVADSNDRTNKYVVGERTGKLVTSDLLLQYIINKYNSLCKAEENSDGTFNQ